MIHIFYGQDKNNISFERLLFLHMHKDIKQIEFKNNHDEIICFAMQSSLFNSNDALIDNASFFYNKTQNDSHLISTLINSTNDIFCFHYDDKIDTIQSNVIYHKIAKFNNVSKHKLVFKLISDLNIKFENEETKLYFEFSLPNDPFMIKNECEKISLFARNAIITKKQIIDNCISVNNPNIFEIVNLILQCNKVKLIKLYDNLILFKFQPVELLSILNSQLFNIKLYIIAKNKGWSIGEITEKLNLNSYIIATYKALTTNIINVNELISQLWQLEYNIKHNNINPYLGFKLFLLK